MDLKLMDRIVAIHPEDEDVGEKWNDQEVGMIKKLASSRNGNDQEMGMIKKLFSKT